MVCEVRGGDGEMWCVEETESVLMGETERLERRGWSYRVLIVVWICELPCELGLFILEQ